MKTYLIVLMLLIACLQLHGQVKKGGFLIGTSSNLIGSLTQLRGGSGIGFQYATDKEIVMTTSNISESKSTVTAFNFSPYAGIMVSNITMVGLGVGVFRYTEQIDNLPKTGSTILSFTPTVRFYFDHAEKITAFGELRQGFLYTADIEDDESTVTPFINAKFGGAFFLNPKVSLDFFAEYTYNWDRQQGRIFLFTPDPNSPIRKIRKTVFGIGFGLSIFLHSKNDE